MEIISFNNLLHKEPHDLICILKRILSICLFYLLDCFQSQVRISNLCGKCDKSCLNFRALSRIEPKIPRI